MFICKLTLRLCRRRPCVYGPAASLHRLAGRTMTAGTAMHIFMKQLCKTR